MNPLTDLLAGRDRWTGAACVGEWELFDPRGEHEPAELHALRIEYARAICGVCPVLTECHATAQNMRPADRSGVWAGIAYDIKGRPVRIPTKETPQ